MQLIMLSPVSEVWFFWMHYFMHSNEWMYENIHCVHHEFTAPMAPCCIYCHPLEMLIVNIPTTFGGPLISGAHVTMFYVAILPALLSTLKSHSGWHLPIIGGDPEGHDYHHVEGFDNLGTDGIFDRVMKTDQAWHKSWQRDVAKTYHTIDYPLDKVIASYGKPPVVYNPLHLPAAAEATPVTPEQDDVSYAMDVVERYVNRMGFDPHAHASQKMRDDVRRVLAIDGITKESLEQLFKQAATRAEPTSFQIWAELPNVKTSADLSGLIRNGQTSTSTQPTDAGLQAKCEAAAVGPLKAEAGGRANSEVQKLGKELTERPKTALDGSQDSSRGYCYLKKVSSRHKLPRTTSEDEESRQAQRNSPPSSEPATVRWKLKRVLLSTHPRTYDPVGKFRRHESQ